MSNSAVLFVPAARCCARVSASLRRCLRFSRPPASPWGHQRQRPSRQRQFRLPDEGWMERRQPHSQLRSRLRRATPHPGATGTTSALHRGDFRMRTHEAGSRQWNRSRTATSRARPYDWRSGSEPPAVRFAPQPRDATPGSVSRIVSGRRPLLSQDATLLDYIRYVVNIFLRIVVKYLALAHRRQHAANAGNDGLRNRTAG